MFQQVLAEWSEICMLRLLGRSMSPPVHMRAPLRCLLYVMPLCQAAFATDGAWSNPGGGSWTASGNWAAATAAGGVSSLADFSGINLVSRTTVTINGPKTAGLLRFGDVSPSHDWFLRKGNSGNLTLDTATGLPTVEVLNQSVTLGVDLVGSKGLSKSGAGVLVLSGANTYSGPTQITAGTLRLAAPPAFPTGMTVMPLGDSITFGHDGVNAGYRGALYGMLLQLAPTFLFAGTSTERPGFLPFHQQKHEGHSSYSVQDIDHNLDGFDNTTYLLYGGPERNPNGGHWITGGNGTGRGPMIPHAITLMAGTNDLDEPVGFHTRLTALMTKLTTLCPETRIVLARITPVTNQDPVDVPQCNAVIDQVTTEFRAAGKRVTPVDLFTTFPATGLTADGVHPNDTGFSWMAMQWHEGLIQAFTPASGVSTGLPSTTAVTLAHGATLDIAGNEASITSLNASGTLALGQGGKLASTSTTIKSSGAITGSGVIHGAVILNGRNFAHPGQSLTFTGTVVMNGTLSPGSGAQLHFQGDFINNGVCNLSPDSTVTFGGNVINNGVMRYTDGASVQTTGTFENNGTLDLLTGSQTLPANFVDNGWILDSSAVAIESLAMEEGQIRIRIESYSGHIYQLQRSDNLESGSWTDDGEAQTGVTGVSLDFLRPATSPTGREFFRIRVSP